MVGRSRRLHNLGLFISFVLCLCLIAGAVYIYLQSQQAAQPQSPAAVIEVDPIAQRIEQLTPRQKVASLLMLHVSGKDPQRISQFVQTYQPGGIILMGDNVSDNLGQINTLTQAVQAKASPYPLFIAIDEEGCSVKRLPQDTYACAKDLGSQPLTATKQAFFDRSQLLKKSGININFGIVADVTANPDSFIYPRVFGADPKQVARHVAAAVEASQPEVMATIKHFPGHGQTTADSHTSIPQVDISQSQWQNQDAIPFKAGIEAGVGVVMMSHLLYKQIDNSPASLSSKWHSILKNELGFTGLIVTDDLVMLQQSGDPEYQNVIMNVINSINAGNTITLIVNDHNVHEQPQTNIDIDSLLDGVVAAVEDGRVKTSLLDQLLHKSMAARGQLTK